MPQRVQSPSSINTYKQCARRYFYQYIKKLPTSPNIHLIRGNIVHTALEKFFEIDPTILDEQNYKKELASYLSNLFEACWRTKSIELDKVTKSPDQKLEFYNDSKMMLGNWLSDFFDRMTKTGKPFVEAFNIVKPAAVEEKLACDELKVRGFVDVIEDDNGIIKLVDYKTGKPKNKITKEYRLQLGIYALLYKQKHGKAPDKVSIWFLKDKELVVDVDEALLKDATFEIEQIHFATVSDVITDYPTTITPLCKWSTGQCDFYETCLGDRNL